MSSFNSEGVTVWTRENLEPTISIVEEVKIDAKSLPRKKQTNNEGKEFDIVDLEKALAKVSAY